jgi:hypothetical protein
MLDKTSSQLWETIVRRLSKQFKESAEGTGRGRTRSGATMINRAKRRKLLTLTYESCDSYVFWWIQVQVSVRRAHYDALVINTPVPQGIERKAPEDEKQDHAGEWLDCYQCAECNLTHSI